MSSRPDCIFEIHQLWQSGFTRVYSNCYCSCSFEPEIIKISQSSHKMYSNNILNFQESTTILNASTKWSGNVLNTPRIYWGSHITAQQLPLRNLTSCSLHSRWGALYYPHAEEEMLKSVNSFFSWAAVFFIHSFYFILFLITRYHLVIMLQKTPLNLVYIRWSARSIARSTRTNTNTGKVSHTLNTWLKRKSLLSNAYAHQPTTIFNVIKHRTRAFKYIWISKSKNVFIYIYIYIYIWVVVVLFCICVYQCMFKSFQ